MSLRVAPNGEEHGLLKTLGNSCQGDGFQHMTPEAKAKAEKQKKEDSRRIKARYLNHRGQNERLTKNYVRNAGVPIEVWHFIPNEIYDDVPMGLVNEVNTNPGLAQRSELLDKDGVNTIKKDGGYKKIHEFVPVGF